MRNFALALSLAVLPAVGTGALAQTEIDLSGMDCRAKAVALRDYVEARNPGREDLAKARLDITDAQNDCLNGDDDAFADLVARYEVRDWEREDPLSEDG